MRAAAPQCLYIFLDEGGNFDFSPSGTPYFTLTSVALVRPFRVFWPLIDLKYDFLEVGRDVEYFHASSDKQTVRDGAFAVIRKHLDNLRIDSLIVEKAKTYPALRPVERFYPQMLGYLLRYVFEGLGQSRIVSQVIVITDRIPVKKTREAVEKAVKVFLAAMTEPRLSYQVLHHESRSSMGLQIADYCNWAIYRKWNSQDERSYAYIKPAIRSEFEIFRTGTERFY